MFNVNGKSHRCNDIFTDVRFTSVLAKKCVRKIQISHYVWNFHSNWLLF